MKKPTKRKLKIWTLKKRTKNKYYIDFKMRVVKLNESDLTRIVERVLNEQVKEVTNFDKDYDYKKVGTYPGGIEYFFKLKSSPVSEKAKGLKSQGKFKDWTKATGAGLEAIKTKVFKDAPTNTTKTVAPKPTTSEPKTPEPQPTTPERSQGEKINVQPKGLQSVSPQTSTSGVQRQTPSQIPPLTASQSKKMDRMVDKAGKTQASTGQVPTYDF